MSSQKPLQICNPKYMFTVCKITISSLNSRIQVPWACFWHSCNVPYRPWWLTSRLSASGVGGCEFESLSIASCYLLSIFLLIKWSATLIQLEGGPEHPFKNLANWHPDNTNEMENKKSMKIMQSILMCPFNISISFAIADTLTKLTKNV